ncbi:MAG: glycosyltransferase family 2 protein [Armatimonadetes bacterium]|nr:glycosyltransferase family 2 protein [Armatimonadota bacterium]
MTHAQSGHDPRYPTPNTGLQVEVIVVDNASSDGSAEMVRNEFPDVKLIDSGENLGWAKGNNVGIEVSTGRYLFLLNPDTVVHAGALESLTAFMDARPGAGACAPLLLNPDGTIQRSLRRFPEPVSLLWDVLGMAKLFPHSGMFAAYRMGDFPYDRVAEVDQPMGAALFLRKETLERVGLMDEAFPIFFNDVDWCYRAVQAGWKIYFVPKAKVTHYGGSSTSQVKPKMVAESHRSLERFYRKHYRDRIPSAVFQAIMAMSRMAERLRIARARL